MEIMLLANRIASVFEAPTMFYGENTNEYGKIITKTETDQVLSSTPHIAAAATGFLDPDCWFHSS